MPEHGYVTKQQHVKVGDNSILILYVHILPNCSEERRQSPFAWWSDRINQELLAFVHEILIDHSAANIRVTFEGLPKSKSKQDDVMEKFHFRKSPNFRGIFIFQNYTTRIQTLLPTKSSVRRGPVCTAFTNEYGKRVLPVSVTEPFQDPDFGSCKILPDCLHAYVDCYEPFSCLGIFKVLKFLAPKHKVALDIASYFRTPDKPKVTEEDNLFPEVPMAGLQKRRIRKKNNSSKPIKQKSRKLKKRIPSNQPLIDKALQSTTTADNVYTEADLPPDVLDKLYDFTSPPTDNISPPMIENKHESTPPLIRKKLSESSKVSQQPCTKPLKDISANGVFKDIGLTGTSISLKENSCQLNSFESGLFDSLVEPEYIPTDGTCLLATPTTPVPMIIGTKQTTNESREFSNQMNPSLISTVTSSECSTTVDVEGMCMVVSSEEEEVEVTNVKEGQRKRKVKSLLSLEQIMDGVSGLRDLTEKKLIQWLRLRTPVIVDIFKGKLFSQRHNDYLAGAKKKALLKYAVDTSMFGSDQLETLHTNILNLFCSNSMKYFDYVMNVLIPECVVRLIADVSKVSFTEAERIMYSYQSIDLCQDK